MSVHHHGGAPLTTRPAQCVHGERPTDAVPLGFRCHGETLQIRAAPGPAGDRKADHRGASERDAEPVVRGGLTGVSDTVDVHCPDRPERDAVDERERREVRPAPTSEQEGFRGHNRTSHTDEPVAQQAELLADREPALEV